MNFPAELKFTESQKSFLISKFPENIFIGEVKNGKFRLNNKLITDYLKEDLFRIAAKLNLQVNQRDSKKDLWTNIEKKALVIRKTREQKIVEINKLFESCKNGAAKEASAILHNDTDEELVNNFDELELFGEDSGDD